MLLKLKVSEYGEELVGGGGAGAGERERDG